MIFCDILADDEVQEIEIDVSINDGTGKSRYTTLKRWVEDGVDKTFSFIEYTTFKGIN